MMPLVEPKPSSQRNGLLDVTSPKVGGSTLLTLLIINNVAIVTRFARTGVHAAAKNCLRAFKIELLIDVTP